MNKAFLAAGLMLLPTLALAASIGTLFGTPHIAGTIRIGEYEEVQRDFAKGFARPLELKVETDSNPFETLRIGLWLAQRRPALRLRGQCVGACASFLLTSGSRARIEKGTLIAFSTHDEQPALVLDRIRGNPDELFVGSSEMSQLSRARLLERFKLVAQASALMRDSANEMIPASALRFLRELSLPGQIDKVTFDEEHATFNMQLPPGRCLWWIPDAVGLAQLGIDAPGYEPLVERDRAGKILKVDPGLIYIGPVVDPVPEGGLCTARP